MQKYLINNVLTFRVPTVEDALKLREYEASRRRHRPGQFLFTIPDSKRRSRAKTCGHGL